MSSGEISGNDFLKNFSLVKHSSKSKKFVAHPCHIGLMFADRLCRLASVESLWSSMKGRTGDVLASVGKGAWKAAISLGKLSNER